MVAAGGRFDGAARSILQGRAAPEDGYHFLLLIKKAGIISEAGLHYYDSTI